MEAFKTELSKLCHDTENYNSFEKVLKKLQPDFLDDSTRKALNESRCQLAESTQHYFENRIIIDAVLQSIDQQSSCKFFALNDGVHPIFYSAIKKYVPASESSDDVKHFDLCQEYVDGMLEKRKPTKTDQEKFTEAVESNIDGLCSKLMEFCGYKNIARSNRKKTFQGVLKELNAKASHLRNANSAFILAKEQTVHEMLQIYYKELKDGLGLLQDLLKLQEKQLTFESNLSDFYDQKCQALCLKIKIFELEVLNATYTAETIPALKIINDRLDSEHKELEKELNEKSESLQRYQILSPEYELLVKDYTELIKNIKSEKWSLEVLKKRLEE